MANLYKTFSRHLQKKVEKILKINEMPLHFFRLGGISFNGNIDFQTKEIQFGYVCGYARQDILVFSDFSQFCSIIRKIIQNKSKIEIWKNQIHFYFKNILGLVDGDMNYPFDVNQAILWLGELVDLIFVFFDPIGQVT